MRVSDIKDCKAYKSKKPDYWNFLNYADDSNYLKDVIPPFFIIIDEINRAELSRVFGELMYCLEYRGVKSSIKTQYANLNNSETGMIQIGESYHFFIPNNLYVIASMNTIDRSVESFDFALRRRFRWEEVEPDIELLNYRLEQNYKNWTKLGENLKELNKKILKEPLLGKDYRIGHAYLWNLNYPTEMSLSEVRKVIWEDSLESILQEYLRGTGRDSLMLDFKKAFGLKDE